MRVHFQERLDDIRSDVIRMGQDALEMVRQSVDAIVTGDDDLAEAVIRGDDRVDDLERAIFNRTLVAVMQEAPVASDLRVLVASLAIVAEIEKAGDHAVKLARRATKLDGRFPTELKRALTQLGDQSRRLFGSALQLYAHYDAGLADEIILGDHEVDSAFAESRAAVFDLIRSSPEQTEHLVRTMEAFHALEHVADHAVAIAVRMKMLYGGGASER